MTFQIPDLKELAVRARNGFNAELKGTDAWLWPNNVYVTAKVFAGMIWQVFGRLKWIDKQRFAMTATDYELERHAREFGMARKQATFARGNVVVVAQHPTTVPAGTRFTRADGETFDSTVAASTTVTSSYLSIPVSATKAGKTGNTQPETPLTSNVGTSFSGSPTYPVVDEEGIGTGADLENDESLRERVLHRKRQPPMGGSESDYWAWAREITGVTRVFVDGNAYGPGTVAVWFLMDDTYENGIPLPVDVAAMQDHLDNVKPVTARVIVQAPIADCMEVVVKGLSPDTDDVRIAAASELKSMFRNMGGVSTTRNQVALRHSWLWNAVSNATGEHHHTIIAPQTDISFPAGVLPCLAKVRFEQ